MNAPIIIYFLCLVAALLLIQLASRRRRPALARPHFEPLKPLSAAAGRTSHAPQPVRELPPPKFLPWQRLRPCRRGTQLNAGGGMPPCQELHIVWWGWPLELGWRCWRNVFSPPLLRVQYPEPLPEAEYLQAVRRSLYGEAVLDGELRLRDALVRSNDILRSLHAIADREGAETNWCAIRKQLKEVLEAQHALRHDLGLYP